MELLLVTRNWNIVGFLKENHGLECCSCIFPWRYQLKFIHKILTWKTTSSWFLDPSNSKLSNQLDAWQAPLTATGAILSAKKNSGTVSTSLEANHHYYECPFISESNWHNIQLNIQCISIDGEKLWLTDFSFCISVTKY